MHPFFQIFHKIKKRRCFYLVFRRLDISKPVSVIVRVKLYSISIPSHFDRRHGNRSDSGKRIQYDIALIGLSVDDTLYNVQLERADVHLPSSPGLIRIECPHPVDIVPDFHLVP